MRHVADATRDIILGNNRSYTPLVVFSFLACKAPESISLQTPNAQSGSVPDQIVYPYLSHLEDRLFTGQKILSRIFPFTADPGHARRMYRVRRQPHSHIGYIGARANAAGSVSDRVTLFMPATELKKITLRTNPDRIIIDATVRAKTRDGYLLAEKQIRGNSSAQIIFDMPCQGAYILELTVTKHTPHRRVWIVSFYPGFEFAIGAEDISVIKYTQKKTENKEGSIGRLYINSLEMTLNNITRLYDERNADSPVAGYFNANAIIHAKLFLNQPSTYQNFSLDLGTFYLTEIKNDETKPSVQIKAQDYIGCQKQMYLALGIHENTDAYAAFGAIAHALNLATTKIDQSLKAIKLDRLPLNGTVAALLNNLCVLTNVYCSIDAIGSNLIAMPILARHGGMRYPVRYFATNEYGSNDQAESKKNAPNVINLSYAKYEYEQEYQAARKETVMYKLDGAPDPIPMRVFPNKYQDKQYGEYPVGAECVPSLIRTYVLPDNFVTVELSDAFIPKVLEYTMSYTNDPATGKPTTVEVRVWNFVERALGEQLSIALMVMAKPREVMLKKEEYDIPKIPREYIKPSIDPALNIADYDAVLAHNEKNKPQEFSLVIQDAASIYSVEIGNLFLQGKFEFAYKQVPDGVHIKAWNYFDVPQTMTVKLYGNRLIASKEQKTIRARNEDDIQIHGEVIKNIEVGALASDEVARAVLATMSHYYRKFQNSISVQPWSDPRIELYDLLAFKSSRGFGFSQGIVDEIELTYKGFVQQKIRINQTTKHNRDCRLWSAYAVEDRPALTIDFLGYA